MRPQQFNYTRSETWSQQQSGVPKKNHENRQNLTLYIVKLEY